MSVVNQFEVPFYSYKGLRLCHSIGPRFVDEKDSVTIVAGY